MNDLPILDPKPLRDLLDIGAEPGLVQELIALFEEDLPIRMASLRQAVAASDPEQILAEAHQMKGSLGNLGLMRFADLARRIEAYAREGDLDLASGLAEALPAAYDEALRALNTAFPKD